MFVIVHAGNAKKEKVQMCRHEKRMCWWQERLAKLLNPVLTLIQILKKISAVFSTVLIDLSSLVSDTSHKSVNGRIWKVLIMLLCSTFGRLSMQKSWWKGGRKLLIWAGWPRLLTRICLVLKRPIMILEKIKWKRSRRSNADVVCACHLPWWRGRNTTGWCFVFQLLK